jgi:hypothetical protein
MYRRGLCMNEASPFCDGINDTGTDGYCEKWDTFDEDVAFAIMELNERKVRFGLMAWDDVVKMVNDEIDFIPPS